MHGTESPQIEGYNTTSCHPRSQCCRSFAGILTGVASPGGKNSKSFIPSANSCGFLPDRLAGITPVLYGAMADRIVVLQYGTILEEGTHTQLLSNNDLYAELFRLQAEGYQ